MLPNYKDFGFLTVYSGEVGAGATLAAIAHIVELKKQNPKLEIISNTKLNNLKYKTFNLEEIIKDVDTFYDKIVFLDNAWTYLDCRLSQRRINKLLAYLIIAKSRASGLKWVLTSFGKTKKSAEHILDKRVRRHITTHLRCRCYKKYNSTPIVRSLIIKPYRIPQVYNYFKFFSPLDKPINTRLEK